MYYILYICVEQIQIFLRQNINQIIKNNTLPVFNKLLLNKIYSCALINVMVQLAHTCSVWGRYFCWARGTAGHWPLQPLAVNFVVIASAQELLARFQCNLAQTFLSASAL